MLRARAQEEATPTGSPQSGALEEARPGLRGSEEAALPPPPSHDLTGPRPPRLLPRPTCGCLGEETGAEGKVAVCPSVRAAPPVLTPRAAAAAATPGHWYSGPNPLLSPCRCLGAPLPLSLCLFLFCSTQ